MAPLRILSPSAASSCFLKTDRLRATGLFASPSLRNSITRCSAALRPATTGPISTRVQHAKGRGCDEALLFNEHGELVSAALANVFLVQDGIIRTPSLACGARDGVIRSWVLSQTPVRERSLFFRDVQNADEIFLTNSWIGIASATHLEDQSLRSVEIGTRLPRAYETAFLPPSGQDR